MYSTLGLHSTLYIRLYMLSNGTHLPHCLIMLTVIRMWHVLNAVIMHKMLLYMTYALPQDRHELLIYSMAPSDQVYLKHPPCLVPPMSMAQSLMMENSLNENIPRTPGCWGRAREPSATLQPRTHREQTDTLPVLQCTTMHHMSTENLWKYNTLTVIT